MWQVGMILVGSYTIVTIVLISIPHKQDNMKPVWELYHMDMFAVTNTNAE